MTPSRRSFLQQAGLAALGVSLPWQAQGAETATLPFENGERQLVKFPGKRPLMVLTHRPPQLETPFEVFNDGVLTPNDAFFVRYHLAGLPTAIDPEKFRLEVKGEVERPQSLSLADVKKLEPVEVVAVNQCSGNSRGYVEPRASGGQWGHGAMGNARWKGARLKDVLAKAGVKGGARQVVLNGLDTAPLPQTPDYIKALEIEHALDSEVIVAYEMNGEPLPFLNGFPLRLVVPGYYATYWVKHLSELTVVPEVFDGFWMAAAYRIPKTPDGGIPPGTVPPATVPIGKMNVRSFITSLANGGTVPRTGTLLRGIAFDGGTGIRTVEISDDGGSSWQPAKLGEDLGKYSFREWTLDYRAPKGHAGGEMELLCRATNGAGAQQPEKKLWNPPGYMLNNIERLRVKIS